MPLPVFHIVDRFDVPWSGSALEALALHDLLRSHAMVRIWSTLPPHPSYSPYPIEVIAQEAGHFPRGGTLVLVGGYYELGEWLHIASPDRIIVKYNSFTHLRFFAWLTELKAAGLPTPHLVFPSKRLRDAVAMEGMVEPSPIDLDRFRPAGEGNATRQYTVGRLSRDEIFKHHEDDLSLYKMLGFDGCNVRLMGGTCLSEYLLSDADAIELMPAGAETPEEFLHSLDCFFYRTGLFEETFGRVVLEAMATGLPVVCHRRGGYTEWIRSGENGFLFDSQEEAYDIITMLRRNPGRSRLIGQAARKTAEDLFGEPGKSARRQWYLSG